MPLLDEFGQGLDFGDYVVAVRPVTGGIAFALADGRVAMGAAAPVVVHDGGLLSASAYDGAVVSGGEDGLVRLTRTDGDSQTLADFAGRWVEQLTAHPQAGIAAATAKTAHIVKPGQGVVRSFANPATVQSLAFDPKGKRLACAHYNGVSLWWTNSQAQTPAILEWKGAHMLVTWSPDGRFIVTAMQENALHGWRLDDKSDMRMGGYPAKTKSFDWAGKGRWLATSGAQSVICWPFADKSGPMGKSGLELPGTGGLTTVVAAHPKSPFVAAGFSDGAVMMFRLDDEAELLVAAPADAPVSALAFSGDGNQLGFGREDGSAGLLALPA